MGARLSTFKKDPEEVKAARVWSPEQESIFDWFQFGGQFSQCRAIHPGKCDCPHNQKHLIVDALAGVGKTTTLIEGVNRSPEQYVLICAFNKQIADELQSRATRDGVEAKTLHSLGYFFIRREWRGIPVSQKGARALFLTEQVTDRSVPPAIKKLINAVHTKGRDLTPTDYSVAKLVDLMIEFDLEPDEGWAARYDTQWIAGKAFEAMRHAAEHPPTYDVGVDFADMMFLPFAWGLLEAMYDLVVVDEMQDMSKAQLQMAQAVCRGRIAGFGDRHQAIYGFRGADTGSMARITSELQAGVLPLHTTYRCAQTVAQEAQRLVPELVAAPTNPQGTVQAVHYPDMLLAAQPGDFIVSRLNAPLVEVTLRLLMMRKKARMRGRQIGEGLVALIRRLVRNQFEIPIEEFEQRLDAWERKTVAKLLACGQQEMAHQTWDRAAMIRAFAENSPTVAALMADIERLFVDTEEADTILCSSIHKVKGLEARTVYVLQETLYRRGESEDERNCDYVARTRAIENLRYVSGVPGMEKR